MSRSTDRRPTPPQSLGEGAPNPRRRLFCLSPLALGGLGLLGTAGGLTACGGGGGGAEPVSPPAGTTSGSVALGTITGFGSIIVNGIRYDDSGAEVFDDHGQRRGRDDLKLGAKVEIEARSLDRSAGTAVATVITSRSELKGPIASIDVSAGQFVVLGQTVAVDARTVFDDSLASGLAGLAVGQWVEVHGNYDAAQALYLATRVEREDSRPGSYKLRGPVASLDTTARSFRLGEASISYAALSSVPANLANGLWVRVEVQTSPVAGVWQATSLRTDDGVGSGNHDEAEVEGTLTAFTSVTQFSVNGVPVDASAAVFEDGQAGIVLGARVEVEGAWVNGVLVARKVEIEDRSSDDDGSGEGEFELHGTISALDTTAKTFVLRGWVVRYGGSVTYRDGSEAQLANGVSVEVKGRLTANGTQIEAQRISFED